MKKKNFVSMILGTIGGILFSIGMCMCLLPEWAAYKQGVGMGVCGMLVLLVMMLVRRKMENKPMIQLNGKAIGCTLLGIIGALTFGIGMCLVMVLNKMVTGIVVGIIGLVLLMCLIPLYKGVVND